MPTFYCLTFGLCLIVHCTAANYRRLYEYDTFSHTLFASIYLCINELCFGGELLAYIFVHPWMAVPLPTHQREPA